MAWCTAVAEAARTAYQRAAHRAGPRVGCRAEDWAAPSADSRAVRLACRFAARVAEAWACQSGHFPDSEPAAQREFGPGVALFPSCWACRGDSRLEQSPELACRLGRFGHLAFWTGQWLPEAEQRLHGRAAA